MPTEHIRCLELLAPAGNADIAIEAVRHGADAVYIGAPSHGARQSAANSFDDIKRVVEYAHIFNAGVYVTVNTIIFEKELTAVELMIRELYRIGVDALIVQDMGILRLDIPPIALHASTQCDIRTPEKALFLQEAGFSQIVLARELSTAEIKMIVNAVEIPVETFIHGALCVSYSGRCGAGFAAAGRSGNRGECPQICRQAFSLIDADGKILARNKYLLSLKDLNTEKQIDKLVEAGVSSFKIEGRLKEAGYVKNVVSAYSKRLNEIIARSEGTLKRKSAGESLVSFRPQLDKSFNRGFTSYYLSGNPDSKGLASLNTPKSLGELIRDKRDLKPGDGISFFDRNGNYTGLLYNGFRNGKPFFNNDKTLPANAEIHRTSSIEWKKLMNGDTAVRKIKLNISLDKRGVTAVDETGAMVRLSHNVESKTADKETDYKKVFEKLGNTVFELDRFSNEAFDLFFPLSALTSLRRELTNRLIKVKLATYRFDYRRTENLRFPYPSETLDYRDNISNSKAAKFYKDHGVTSIKPALETQNRNSARGRIIMSSRYCMLRELGLCLRNKKLKLPLTLESGNLSMHPEFDCKNCEMHLRL